MKSQKYSLIFSKNDKIIHENSYKNLSSDNNIFRFNLLDHDTILDLKNKQFIRENDQYLFKIDIKNNTCSLHLKKEELFIDIIVDFCNLQIQSNQIIFEYVIESDDAKNKLVIEKSEINE